MLLTRRLMSRLDIDDHTSLLQHDNNGKSIQLIKNNLLCSSPPPMSYRDLRSIMLNKTPTKFVLMPNTLNATTKSIKNGSSLSNPTYENSRKSASRRKYRRHGTEVYRPTIRANSRCSILSEHVNINNENLVVLADAFIVDHVTSTPTSGFFHPQSLPNVQKQRSAHSHGRVGSSYTKGSCTPSPSLQIKHLGKKQSVAPPQLVHRTTPIDDKFEISDNATVATSSTETKITTTTTTKMFGSLHTPDTQSRKQLHVYVPQIISC